jgi:hypothetical protein
MTVLPGKAMCRSPAGAIRDHDHSSQPDAQRTPARRPDSLMSPDSV